VSWRSALLAFGVMLVGCGEGGGSEELVSRLPGDARALSVIDLAEVKERLGLPEDADPVRPPGDSGSEAQTRLFAYAGNAFPYLARFDRTFMEAIDESRVKQAATTPVSGPDTVVVLATDQPFDDEIAKRLERAGYRKRDGVLVNEDAGGPGGFAAVGGEDGVVVLAGDARAARAALDGEQPGGPTRELLNEIDAPVRDATSLAGGGDTCVRGVALGDSIDPPELEVVVRVSGGASADRVEDPASDAGDAFSAGEPEAEGDLGRLPLTYRPRPGTTPIQALVARIASPYRCPDA
jgi:hypothetical protein